MTEFVFMAKKPDSNFHQKNERRSAKKHIDPRFFLPMLFLAAIILALSSIPHLKFGFEPHYEQIARKTVHIVIYAMLAILMWLSFPVENTRKKLFKAAICFLVLAIFAVFDEYLQTYVPGRRGNLKGVLFDLAGIVLGIFAVWVWEKREAVGR